MNLKNKLEGIPHVYYVNLDERIDRKNYMEDQFKKWGIEKYTRISASKFLVSEKHLWKDLIIGDTSNSYSYAVAHALTHFDFFKEWLNETDDPYLILMEDDYDLGLIEYWHFDWSYLMERIPYDWDCIQLGFETGSVIPFYLHPVNPEYSLGPCLMKRDYIEKLVMLHCVGNLYKLDNYIANMYWKNNKGYQNVSGTGDYFLCQNGNSYAIPLLLMNPYFGSFENDNWLPRPYYQICWDTCYDWWKYDRDKFTLDEFFTYGKSNDILMQRNISNMNTKYFLDKLNDCREKFLVEYGK